MLGPRVCDVAATEGPALTGMSLFEAAQWAVSHLEHQRDAGLPLNPGAVKLASLLAWLEGESAVSGRILGRSLPQTRLSARPCPAACRPVCGWLASWEPPSRDSGSGTATGGGMDFLRSHSPVSLLPVMRGVGALAGQRPNFVNASRLPSQSHELWFSRTNWSASRSN